MWEIKEYELAPKRELVEVWAHLVEGWKMYLKVKEDQADQISFVHASQM